MFEIMSWVCMNFRRTASRSRANTPSVRSPSDSDFFESVSTISSVADPGRIKYSGYSSVSFMTMYHPAVRVVIKKLLLRLKNRALKIS